MEESRIGSQATIGFKKEATWGTFITPDMYYRSNSENFLPKYDFVQDDTLIGNQLPATKWVVGMSVEGTLDGPLFPDQIGHNIISVLGGEAAVADPVVAYLIVSYNGASAYARLTKTAGDLLAELSSNGSSWSADTNFNTTGTIDVTAAAFDTLTELAAAINTYTGWDAIICGAGATASSTIADFTATNLKAASIKQGAYILKAVNTSATDCKLHSVYPNAQTSGIPSYSFITNRGLGTNKSLTFAGMNTKTLTISNTAKDVIKCSQAMVGKIEAIDQNDVSITVPTIVPFKVANLKVIVEDSSGNLTEMTELNSINLVIDPGLNDNRKVGSLYPLEPTRQQQKYELATNANATTAQYALISKFKANDVVSFYLYGKTDDYVNSTYSIPYSFMIRIPNFMFNDFTSPTSNKDVYVIDMPGQTYKSSSSVYTHNLDVFIVDAHTSTY